MADNAIRIWRGLQDPSFLRMNKTTATVTVEACNCGQIPPLFSSWDDVGPKYLMIDQKLKQSRATPNKKPAPWNTRQQCWAPARFPLQTG
eukprot:1150779-Pelagomonas_calceolata.AAC.2